MFIKARNNTRIQSCQKRKNTHKQYEIPLVLTLDFAWECLAEGQGGREDEEGSHRVYNSTLNEARCESDAAHGTPPSFYAILER